MKFIKIALVFVYMIYGISTTERKLFVKLTHLIQEDINSGQDHNGDLKKYLIAIRKIIRNPSKVDSSNFFQSYIAAFKIYEKQFNELKEFVNNNRHGALFTYVNWRVAVALALISSISLVGYVILEDRFIFIVLLVSFLALAIIINVSYLKTKLKCYNDREYIIKHLKPKIDLMNECIRIAMPSASFPF